MLSLKRDFGAIGDGSTDDTLAVQNAINASAASGCQIFAEIGTYLCSGLVLKARTNILGEHRDFTKFVCKAGTNGAFIAPLQSDTECNDVILDNFTIDGNWSAFAVQGSGNTAGDTLIVSGYNPRLHNLTIQNSPGVGLTTNNATNQWSFRLPGTTPHLQNIMITQIAKHGWIHNGESDLCGETIYIVDTSLSSNGTYYGAVLNSNGRFHNLHPWNTSQRSVVAAGGVYVASNGNNFVNCHFEGSQVPLIVTGGNNNFEGCTYYASRGQVQVSLNGGTNRLTGVLLGSDHPTYGIWLASAYNMIDVVDNGCTLGSVVFNTTNGEAANYVRVRGYRTGPGYYGAPSGSTDVDLMIGGASSYGRLKQVVA